MSGIKVDLRFAAVLDYFPVAKKICGHIVKTAESSASVTRHQHQQPSFNDDRSSLLVAL
jgi:hypothetical protein